MSTKRFFIFYLLVSFLFTSTVYLCCSVYDMEQNINYLTYESTQQTLKIEEMNREVEDAQDSISIIREMTSSHENCVALAVLMNSDSVLADQYDRTEEEQNELYGNDTKYTKFYGRLYIPDAEIDIALYRGYQQSITDRSDSANIFTWGTYTGENIADHNNQEFRKLFSVEEGTRGYIQLENNDIVNIKCIEVLNGHNTGQDITDEDYNTVMGKADYLMYTCRNGWRNIRICLWEKC